MFRKQVAKQQVCKFNQVTENKNSQAIKTPAVKINIKAIGFHRRFRRLQNGTRQRIFINAQKYNRKDHQPI